MPGESGLEMILLLSVLTVLLFAAAGVGAWLLHRRYPGIGGKGSRQIPARPEGGKPEGEDMWGDEGGGGESTRHKAA